MLDGSLDFLRDSRRGMEQITSYDEAGGLCLLHKSGQADEIPAGVTLRYWQPFGPEGGGFSQMDICDYQCPMVW